MKLLGKALSREGAMPELRGLSRERVATVLRNYGLNPVPNNKESGAFNWHCVIQDQRLCNSPVSFLLFPGASDHRGGHTTAHFWAYLPVHASLEEVNSFNAHYGCVYIFAGDKTIDLMMDVMLLDLSDQAFAAALEHWMKCLCEVNRDGLGGCTDLYD